MDTPKTPNHLHTPCCGKPMVPYDGFAAGRPCVMFNPDNEVVQCHRCGTVWAPEIDKDPDESAVIDTICGRKLDLLHPDPDIISLLSVSVGLSRECRYGRQCPIYYSVAEHSFLMAAQCVARHPDMLRLDPDRFMRLQLRCFIHDGSEAYLGDMPGPVKRTKIMSWFRAVEDALQEAVYAHWGLPPHHEDHALVHELDMEIREEEKSFLWGGPGGDFGVRGMPAKKAALIFTRGVNDLHQGIRPFVGADV